MERKKPAETSKGFDEWCKQFNMAYKQAEVIIAKQRHGPVGTVKLYFEGSLTKFGNLADIPVGEMLNG